MSVSCHHMLRLSFTHHLLLFLVQLRPSTMLSSSPSSSCTPIITQSPSSTPCPSCLDTPTAMHTSVCCRTSADLPPFSSSSFPPHSDSPPSYEKAWAPQCALLLALFSTTLFVLPPSSFLSAALLAEEEMVVVDSEAFLFITAGLRRGGLSGAGESRIACTPQVWMAIEVNELM